MTRDPELKPYTYTIVYEITVQGDGLHSDGEGATATDDRLRETIRADRNVLDLTATASTPRYIGPNKD